ncbi:MAG: 4-hydroxy-tetrahydrodipicolinate reductase [Clostridia bacterium]|nr:4-hydroxy-tetrahydrodipicolinate reductase [Clostridia bacterium]
MINILLSGANGKMGQAVTRAVEDASGIKIVAGYDINTEQKSDYPVYDNLSEVKEQIDVIIDFSHPAMLDSLLDYATSNNIPAVICTTGLTTEQISRIEFEAKRIPLFFSANMSLGVNLLIDLVCRASKILENNFDIEIIEKHHNQKLDAPSGTALAIADAISNTISYPAEYIYDRHSVRKKRDKKEIGIHAVRGGTIVGEHSVIFAGTDEVIELKHSATSKEVFAVGAVKAAEFLTKQNAGLYAMKDLINSQN